MESCGRLVIAPRRCFRLRSPDGSAEAPASAIAKPRDSRRLAVYCRDRRGEPEPETEAFEERRRSARRDRNSGLKHLCQRLDAD